MTSFTYSTLKTAIYDFTADSSDELTAQVDTLIGNGMEMVVRDLDLDIFRKEQSGTFTASTATVNKNADVLVIKSFRLDSGGRLHPRSQDFVEDFGTTTGKPQYFSDEKDTQLTVAPRPASALAYTIRYLSRPTPLSDSNPSNWVSLNLGDLLLYACLIQAERFLMASGTGRSGEWEELYASQLEKARGEFDDIRRKDYRPMQKTEQAES